MSKVITKWITDENVTKEKVNSDIATVTGSVPKTALEKTAKINPMKVRVDNVTIRINDNNDLETMGNAAAGELECFDYDGVTNPSANPTAWKNTGDNATLAALSPSAFIAYGGTAEFSNSDYDDIEADDAAYFPLAASTVDYGEYTLYRGQTTLDENEVQKISVDIVSFLDSTFDGNEVIDSFDSVTNWISSDLTNTVVSLNTTVHVEGTGCMQVNTTNGESKNDTVTRTFGTSLDLTYADRILWEGRTDYEGSRLTYFVWLEDSVGNKKRSPLMANSAEYQIWESYSLLIDDFEEDQGPSTDMSDIKKIYFEFYHVSRDEIGYFDNLRVESLTVSKRQELSIWNDTDSQWEVLAIGENSPSDFENITGTVESSLDEYINSSYDIYYRIRSLDSVIGTETDTLKIDYVKLCIDSRFQGDSGTGVYGCPMLITFGKNSKTGSNPEFLYTVHNIPSNKTGYRAIRAGRLTGISWQAEKASKESGDVKIFINDVDSGFLISVPDGAIGNQATPTAVNFSAGDTISCQCNGGKIYKPVVLLEIQWREV